MRVHKGRSASGPSLCRAAAGRSAGDRYQVDSQKSLIGRRY